MSKFPFTVIIYLLGGFSLIILAAIMACKGVGGWGWFLIVGFLIVGSFSYGDKEKEDKKNAP